MEATFAPAFLLGCVWRNLTNLRRVRDIFTFHALITGLARQVGESPDAGTAHYGLHLWDI